ncbi:MAG TPA: c-type cytochrome biogenesis protein CcsB [Candidatus Binataceae bacterium]|nr:c-type cytochrome biogenesis protein CcsB [Candidatus Binataceae bacterium]
MPALACYLASSAGFVSERVGVSGDSPLRSLGIASLGLGAALQTAYLVIGGLQAGNVPVTNLAQSLVFLAWLIALAGLGIILRLKMQVIGTFVAPVITVALIVAIVMIQPGRLSMPASLRSAWLPVHVTLAFLGVALFVLAACVSVVYLVYEKRLKAKRALGPSDSRAPSLEKLDRVNYHLLGWGFLMLSLAIVTGAIWADATWGHFWSWEPQETWSLAIWLLYAGLLESRLTAGWRGHRVAALTLVVFTILIGSFVGVSLLTPGKHGGNFG